MMSLSLRRCTIALASFRFVRALSSSNTNAITIATTSVSPTSGVVSHAAAASTMASCDAGIQQQSQRSCPRHSAGDAILKLNVGGKEFMTLRSTVCSNAVLFDYVQRAEQNGEFYQGAIFIDRDPTHFGLILSFLRNRMEGIAYNSRYTLHNGKLKKVMHPKPNYVRLPQDQDILQDLYVEATHYQIIELQRQLCGATLWTQLFSASGGNPYEQLKTFFQQVKRVGAVALLGTTGTTVYLSQVQKDLDSTLGFHVPLPFVQNDDKKQSHDNNAVESVPSVA